MMNLPDYNFLSAPLWLVTLLHWITLTLHFVAMNFVLGGGLVLLFGKLDDKWNHPIIRRFIKLFPTLMAATITLGVAPLLFLQLTFHRQAYSAAIVSAWPWLFVLVAVMIAYYLLYGASFAKNAKHSTLLALALICMAYVAFVYSATFALVERPAAIAQHYADNQSGLFINPDIGAYGLRWLHMILGALTVGGFFVGLLGRSDDKVYALGKKFFLYGMVAAMIIGLAYLFTLGVDLQPFMRGYGIWSLTVGIILSLAALHFFFKKSFFAAGAMTLVSMLAMVITRHALRLVRLDGIWEPATIPIRPQWSVLAMFLICFVLALGLVWYMLRSYFGSIPATAKKGKARARNKKSDS
ncbi:MAG: hypothetical protein ABII79_03675 [bacterium]